MKLSGDIKATIITELACFRSIAEVIEIVRTEFGVTLDRRQVQQYDPKRAGRKPARPLRTLYDETQRRFLDDRAAIPITHRNFRQRERLDLFRIAKKTKNAKLAGELLEQAAKEEGNIYVNLAANRPGELSDEDRIARMRAALHDMDSRTFGESDNDSGGRHDVQ